VILDAVEVFDKFGEHVSPWGNLSCWRHPYEFIQNLAVQLGTLAELHAGRGGGTYNISDTDIASTLWFVSSLISEYKYPRYSAAAIGGRCVVDVSVSADGTTADKNDGVWVWVSSGDRIIDDDNSLIEYFDEDTPATNCTPGMCLELVPPASPSKAKPTIRQANCTKPSKISRGVMCWIEIPP
jgi:hypothetical protein